MELRFVGLSIKRIAKSLFRGVAWLCFAAGAVAFCFGDFVIRAVTGASVVLGVLECIALALLFSGIGGAAMIVADRLEESETEGPTSLGESLRK